MAKHTLKILRCEHRKIFKVCLDILQHYSGKGKASLLKFNSILNTALSIAIISNMVGNLIFFFSKGQIFDINC